MSRPAPIWGLDGFHHHLPHYIRLQVGDLSKMIATRIGMQAGRRLLLSSGGKLLEDSFVPLQHKVIGREISYVVRQVCALEAAIALQQALAERTRDHSHTAVTDAISSLTLGTSSTRRWWGFRCQIIWRV